MGIDTTLFVLGLDTVSLPKSIAVAVLKNGTYTFNGPATHNDVLSGSRFVAYNPPTLVAGVGWANAGANNEGLGPSNALLAILDMTGKGASVVATVRLTGSLSADTGEIISMIAGDLPNWVYGWEGKVHANGSGFDASINDFYGFDPTQTVTDTVFKFGVTLSNALIGFALNQSHTAAGAPDARSAIPNGASPFLDIFTSGVPGASIIVEKVEFYAAQDLATLALLS